MIQISIANLIALSASLIAVLGTMISLYIAAITRITKLEVLVNDHIVPTLPMIEELKTLLTEVKIELAKKQDK